MIIICASLALTCFSTLGYKSQFISTDQQDFSLPDRFMAFCLCFSETGDDMAMLKIAEYLQHVFTPLLSMLNLAVTCSNFQNVGGACQAHSGCVCP